MKLFAISDLHMSKANPKPMNIFGANWNDYLEKIECDWKSKVSEEDIVVVAGDISWAMTIEDAMLDFEYFKKLPGKKVLIRGNHDYWWKSITKLREIVPKDCYLLQNDAIKIGNYIFCGSRGWVTPGTPDFSKDDEKIFLREGERLKMAYSKAESLREEGDRLVGVIHYPPFNARRDDNIITKIMEEHKTDVVIYGHLHGKEVRADKKLRRNGVTYYLTSCDLVENKLVEIEFDN